MIRGSCLCGAVKFEISAIAGPFELCHCSRCRKVTGSAFLPYVNVRREHLRFVQGIDRITTYDAPIREAPPAYRACFCSRCGSPVPDPHATSDLLDVPAGSLDDDPGLRPQRHIYVDTKAAWFVIPDDLPQFDKAAIRRLRQSGKA
jgi:hypothetical protein